MDAHRQITVRLLETQVAVRAPDGHDLSALRQVAPGQTAAAAIGLSERLCGTRCRDRLWPEIERLLLAGYLLLRGTAPELVADCPACGTRAEIAADLRALVAEPPEAVSEAEVDGWTLLLRPPSAEAMDRAAFTPPALAAERLRSHMLVAAHRQDDDAPSELADEAVDRAMARINAAGLILLDLECPSCSAAIAVRLDPFALLRSEAAQAARLARISARSRGTDSGRPEWNGATR